MADKQVHYPDKIELKTKTKPLKENIMKAQFFSGLIISFLFLSCSSDDLATERSTDNFKLKSAAGMPDKDQAANTANTYDEAGMIYSDLLDNFSGDDKDETATIVSTVELDAYTNADFVAISSGYTGITAGQVQWVLNNNANPSAIIAACSTLTVRQQLDAFILIVENHENSSFEQFYNAIVNFEQSVIASNTLTTSEKERILITSSIARYGYYKMSNGGGGGGGWNKFKTSIYGSITGAETNMATAITLSVSAGIAAGN